MLMKTMSDTHASRRLTEILSILQKHHIIRGLNPVKLRCILEDLGPTFVKFGQIMSMRSDILGVEYTRELEKLRTEVQPLDFSIVKSSIEAELSMGINEVFQSISDVPLGSASIAQVHQGKLINGDNVVIKIQRPHIYEIMESDIKLLRKACGMMKMASGTGNLIDFKAIIEELWRTSQIELDFIKEAENIDRFYQFNKDVDYVMVPHVYHEYTTTHMLIMSNCGQVQIDHKTHLKEDGYNMDQLAKMVAENYCKQILDDGYFHADPHPGNIHVYKEKIAWIDFGMMGSITADTQRILSKAITSILEDDIYGLLDAFLLLVKPEQEINQAQLIRQLDSIVEKYMETNFSDFNLGPLIEGCFTIIKTNKVAIPADLTMLTRSMVTMEGTLGKISEKVNLVEILANHMRHKIQSELDLKTQIMHSLQVVYTNMQKGVALPSLSHDVLKRLKNGHLTLHIENDPDKKTLREMRRNNHNITLAIIIGILYLSASLMTLSNLPKVIFDLPLLSLLFFLFGTLLLIRLLIDLRKNI
ncbi:ABC1 kinase family protein [Kandleria vitulina]|nr:AarF/UbiB family protein [Kandleria vitulina]